MSVYESSITNPKKQLEFYKQLSEQLQVENKQLKKQLEELDKKLFLTKNELDMRQKSIDNKLNQQKEFIDYLEKTIEELECDDVDDEEMKGYLIQRIDTFKEIFSKYKEVIGNIFDEKE